MINQKTRLRVGDWGVIYVGYIDTKKYQVCWYIYSTVSVSVSLIHLKCTMCITYHWYIDTDTRKTARNHVKLFLFLASHCNFQCSVHARLQKSQDLVSLMGLCCCSDVFRIRRVFVNSLGFHNTLCAQTYSLCLREVSAKYQVSTINWRFRLCLAEVVKNNPLGNLNSGHSPESKAH